MRQQLKRCRAFGAKVSLANRTLRIAFDRNQFAVFVINELPAAHSAVRANRSRNLRVVDAGVHRARFVGHRFKAGAVGALTNLTDERPFRQQACERRHIYLIA